jgi:hypothetical protein
MAPGKNFLSWSKTAERNSRHWQDGNDNQDSVFRVLSLANPNPVLAKEMI